MRAEAFHSPQNQQVVNSLMQPSGLVHHFPDEDLSKSKHATIFFLLLKKKTQFHNISFKILWRF